MSLDDDGYYTLSFNKRTNTPIEVTADEICDYGVSLSEIQLSQTDERKPFEEPTIVDYPATGIFEEINKVRLEVYNEKEGLHNEFVVTADSLADRIKQVDDNGSEHYNVLMRTVDETSEELLSIMRDELGNAVESNRTSIKTTADGLHKEIEQLRTDGISQINNVHETVDGLRRQITKIVKDAQDGTSINDALFESTVESLRSEMSQLKRDVNGNIDYALSGLNQTVDGIRSEVKRLDNENDNLASRLTQTARVIESKVSRGDVQSMIQQSERNIMLQVASYDLTGKEIVSRINLSPEAVRIAGKKIQIDGDTYIANATIKNSHIASLSADKLTTGTIDASKINVINLKAQNISGMDSEFIRTRWNGIASSVEINPDGLLSTASDSSQVYVQNGIIGVRNPNGASIGQIGYQYDGGSPTYTIRTTLGSHFEIWQTRDNSNTYRIIQLEAGGYAYHNRALQSYFYGARVNVSGELRITGSGENLRLNEGMIIGSYGIEFKHGGRIYTLSGGQATRVNGTRQLQLQVNDVQKMIIDTTRIYMKQDINMQGHNINGQSDARLKKNITDYDYDALSRISKVAFKTFQWKNDNRKDYGFIAQEVKEFAPEWISEEPDGMLAYNDTLLTKVALRGIQQLIEKVKLLEEELHEIKTGTTTTD